MTTESMTPSDRHLCISVLLATGHELISGALCALLTSDADIEIVGHARTGEEVPGRCCDAKPQVAIIDAGIPGLGINHLAALQLQCPDTAVVLLAEECHLDTVRAALASGVCGIISLNAQCRELTAAVRAATRGHPTLDAQLTVSALRRRPSPLSLREHDILARVGSGAAIAEIAAALYLSQGTVRNHVSSALTKLGARNRVDALRIARANGWA